MSWQKSGHATQSTDATDTGAPRRSSSSASASHVGASRWQKTHQGAKNSTNVASCAATCWSQPGWPATSSTWTPFSWSSCSGGWCASCSSSSARRFRPWYMRRRPSSSSCHFSTFAVTLSWFRPILSQRSTDAWSQWRCGKLMLNVTRSCEPPAASTSTRDASSVRANAPISATRIHAVMASAQRLSAPPAADASDSSRGTLGQRSSCARIVSCDVGPSRPAGVPLRVPQVCSLRQDSARHYRGRTLQRGAPRALSCATRICAASVVGASVQPQRHRSRCGCGR
mmetsp:Transcript_35529/g.110034  ORF Transcript_35529/g.110034 Transcript_35529/m.110034 type:complete len:284 (-) Transcript_35529:382-1233(-)